MLQLFRAAVKIFSDPLFIRTPAICLAFESSVFLTLALKLSEGRKKCHSVNSLHIVSNGQCKKLFMYTWDKDKLYYI